MAAQETAMQVKSSRFRRFVREVRAELKKVSWPDKNELSAYTGVVFISVLIIAVLIWVVDTGFNEVLRVFIR
ncbi:MAG: secE [Firmicutes bacterium]|nr:secE [Bacillota bacterium]